MVSDGDMLPPWPSPGSVTGLIVILLVTLNPVNLDHVQSVAGSGYHGESDSDDKGQFNDTGWTVSGDSRQNEFNASSLNKTLESVGVPPKRDINLTSVTVNEGLLDSHTEKAAHKNATASFTAPSKIKQTGQQDTEQQFTITSQRNLGNDSVNGVDKRPNSDHQILSPQIQLNLSHVAKHPSRLAAQENLASQYPVIDGGELEIKSSGRGAQNGSFNGGGSVGESDANLMGGDGEVGAGITGVHEGNVSWSRASKGRDGSAEMDGLGNGTSETEREALFETTVSLRNVPPLSTTITTVLNTSPSLHPSFTNTLATQTTTVKPTNQSREVKKHHHDAKSPKHQGKLPNHTIHKKGKHTVVHHDPKKRRHYKQIQYLEGDIINEDWGDAEALFPLHPSASQHGQQVALVVLLGLLGLAITVMVFVAVLWRRSVYHFMPNNLMRLETIPYQQQLE